MITEDYVSYEVAKLLKEKGFDEYCRSFYELGEPRVYVGSNGVCSNTMFKDASNECIARPTHQMAMKWLREVHGFFIQIGYYEDWADDADGKKVDYWNYWGIDIFYLPSGELHEPENTDQYDTYEEAVEAALKYCLTELI